MKTPRGATALAIGNSGKLGDAATGGHAVGGHAARRDATGDCYNSCDQPRSHDTSPDRVGQTHGSGGGGVSARVPGVRRRYPADRVTPKPGPVSKRLPAGAGPRRTGGSQAGEGQDGFAPRTAGPPPVSPARGPLTEWGELVQVHFRPGDFSGVTRRAARHRHPQPLTAFHATVRTAREKSGFKTGSSQREKPGLERG